MERNIFTICLLFICCANFSQTFNWSTATRTGTAPNYTYTGTGVKAVVSTNAVTMGDATPRTDGNSGNSACYLASPSLGIYAATNTFDYRSSSNSNITVTFYFSSGYGCNNFTFNIKDINSNESTTTFLDVVEISGTYGNSSTALPSANITSTLTSSDVRRVNGTNLVTLIGHNSTSETIPSTLPNNPTSCTTNTITITPPAGFPLATVKLKYRPGYGTSSSNAYYNSGTNTAAQWVSYSNPVFVATSGCTVLPIELTSFDAKRVESIVKLNWQTASEKNNDYFTLERSVDGINFKEFKRLKGAGNSDEVKNYGAYDENPSNKLSYYRLKQTDYNGQYKYSNIISIDADNSKATVSHIAPNPTTSDINFYFYTSIKGELIYEVTDLTGRVIISKSEMMEAGNTKVSANLDEIPDGIYFLKVSFEKTNLISVNKIFKN